MSNEPGLYPFTTILSGRGIAQLADDPVVVGRVGGAYGIRGWVRIASYTDPPGNLLGYRPWFLRRASSWQPLQVLAIEPRGDGFVASLSGIDDRDRALALRGCEIGVPASCFPPADAGEYYWRDLIGLRVVNRDGALLGTIERLIETGANDVMVVKGERERLIPFVAHFVTEVLPGHGVVRVDWEDFD